MEQNIYLALRFHTNFYHSYRGDTPDEKGFGKDIRIITSILDDLDRLNGEGIPVQGTWDIENFFSLEKIMPAFSPELIGRLQERVKTGRDAVAPMSWNNGIVSVSTEEEFDQITRWTISNPMGSGLADLFDSWEPVLRPQECMYTPSFLKRYPEQGIQAISLYYSAHPFNGFSNFMPELSLKERYNPLRVVSRDQGGEMIMVPAYNNGDVADHWLSLRRWIKSMRREQLATPDTGDLLLLIDMDADDEFWSGMEIPLLTRLAPSFDGLYRMIRSLDGLDYLKFITAGEYLKTHKPAGTIELNQDTADGSRDGLSSWAEKWSNTHLWTLLNESRRLDRFTDALGGAAAEPPEKTEAREMRLKSLTTTHFGLSSPVMNRHRLQIAGELAARTAELSAQALKQVSSAAAADTEAEILLPPGTAGGTGLVRLRTETHGERKLAENPEDLQTLKGIQLVRTGEEEAGFLYNCPGGEAPQADETGIRNGLVSLESDKAGNSLIRCGEA
ncbi:MAG: hypothetical protein PQJ58_10740, partial [Spirochaetales bacterium]|nr:hypothetical protein [Spirochaetales bacterium]